MTRLVLGLALALGLLAPATASAGMQLGMQDDQTTVMSGPEAAVGFLQRSDLIGATTVRYMVADNRWDEHWADYARSMQQAKLSGKRVSVALMAWQSRPTAREWCGFARRVIPALAPWVDSWSPLNEPNHDKYALRAADDPVRRARAYRRAWNCIAPLIRRVDPSAKRVCLDQAPSTGNRQFARAFLRRLKVRCQRMAVHPYSLEDPATRTHRDGSWQVDTIEDASRFARRHRLKLWITEWAYRPNAPAEWWPNALKRFERADVKLCNLYDDLSPTWDTKMREPAFAKLRERAAAR